MFLPLFLHSTSDPRLTSLPVKQTNCAQNCQILLRFFFFFFFFLSDGDLVLHVREYVLIIIFSAFDKERAEVQNVSSVSRIRKPGDRDVTVRQKPS